MDYTICTDLFLKAGLSNKTEFTPEEFDYAKYDELLAIQEKTERQGMVQTILSSLLAQMASVDKQIADVGVLPADAPADLADRAGWVTLKNQLDNLTAQKSSLQSQIDQFQAEADQLAADLKSLGGVK